MKPLPNPRQAKQDLYAAIERNELDLRQASKRMRRIVGLSQPAYAKLVGISTQALINFERGATNPTVKTLNAIGRPFGLEVGFRRKSRL